MAVKCQRCRAPLTGFMSYLNRILGIKASEQNPNICNKCMARGKITDTQAINQTAQKEEILFGQSEQLSQAASAPASNGPENIDRQSAKEELENELK